MIHDIDTIKNNFTRLEERIKSLSQKISRPLTLSEKILFSHVDESDFSKLPEIRRGQDYLYFYPDRVAMQDATAQMALLQFMNANKKTVTVPSSVHCDHLVVAENGNDSDLLFAQQSNAEVYDFLQSVSQKYGIGFWKPGAGIIHQIVLENYAFPGGLLIGTDSHTVNAGGLGMIAVGVGGADAADVMSGMPWELKMPKLIGVKLIGTLPKWVAPKDIILKLAGLLTVKGATNAIIEYFGEGTRSLSCTGKATICNMGAEVGATTSIFAYDDSMKEYLSFTLRDEIVEMADAVSSFLVPDAEVEAQPEKYYDSVVEINLSELEPYINGPFSPDVATPLSEFAARAKAEGWPLDLQVGLIGSCTNSSYEDLTHAASLARQVYDKKIPITTEFYVSPGSEMIKETAQRDGLIADFEKIGAVVLANACGPCIGQWKRKNDNPDEPNSIITSFNRNFAKRNDGNPHTFSFVASPEIVTALTIAGRIDFNPATDYITNSQGEKVLLDSPYGDVYPSDGFVEGEKSFIPPSLEYQDTEVIINPSSQRLQKLFPFAAWDGNDIECAQLLIKTAGKCTTDHISMAGPWLRFRGHLENISDNLLMGAVNAFNQQTNLVLNSITGEYDKVSAVAKYLKQHGKSSIVIAEDNYGEGSSREHAAMEPRFLGVRAVIAKSFARIHETNLKKQGVLALTFLSLADYDKIREDDMISIIGLDSFVPGTNLKVELLHADNSKDTFEVAHTYNETQIEWFRVGSALNLLAKKQ
ncbi:MAG: aconitate hydratase [Bacteroidales bacterium]|jgi:aconitate hydratase|nr:aconitate hydratase [Bacteroidales bacterium]